LFVAANLAGAGIGAISRQLIPLMTATVLTLLAITYMPSMTRVITWFFLR